MFFGTYHHRLNSKNQVTVPARFREAIDEAQEGKGLFLFVAESQCLYLFTPRGVEEMVQRARQQSSAVRQDFLRVFDSRVTPVECDAQGRIVIPAHMKGPVGIDHDVVFVGAHRRMEIWSPGAWEKFEGEHRAEYQGKLGEIVGEVFGL